jgi:glycosyltransferase involved in cell wall biosynthesis
MARVLMIITNFNPIIGGAEKQAELLANNLLLLGHKLFILTRRHKNWSKFQIINTIPVYRRRGFPFFGTLSELSTAAIFCMFLYRRRKNFEIVHLHQGTLLTSITCYFSKKILQKKIICKIANSGDKFDLNTLEKRYKYIGNFLKRILVKNVDIFISLNQIISKQLIDLNLYNAITIPNGVEISGHLNNSKELELKRRIISTSRLTPQKNIDLLIIAYSKLHTIYENVNLVLFGDGPSRDDLFDLAVELNIPRNRIFFQGNVTNIRNIFQNGDIFVLPSFVEGMSNSLLEAFSYGIPCIVSNIPENLEVITCDYDALSFDPLKVNDLVNKLEILLKSDIIYNNLSSNCRNTSINRFDIKAIAVKYISLYNKLLLR